MQFCKTRTESFWIRKLVAHVNKITKKKIGLGRGQAKSASAVGSWHKRRHSLVKLGHGVEFPSHHDPTGVIGGALRNVNQSRPFSSLNLQYRVQMPKGTTNVTLSGPQIVRLSNYQMILSIYLVFQTGLPSERNVSAFLLPIRR